MTKSLTNIRNSLRGNESWKGGDQRREMYLLIPLPSLFRCIRSLAAALEHTADTSTTSRVEKLSLRSNDPLGGLTSALLSKATENRTPATLSFTHRRRDGMHKKNTCFVSREEFGLNMSWCSRVRWWCRLIITCTSCFSLDSIKTEYVKEHIVPSVCGNNICSLLKPLCDTNDIFCSLCAREKEETEIHAIGLRASVLITDANWANLCLDYTLSNCSLGPAALLWAAADLTLHVCVSACVLKTLMFPVCNL